MRKPLSSEPPATGAGEHILVVDDEPALGEYLATC